MKREAAAVAAAAAELFYLFYSILFPPFFYETFLVGKHEPPWNPISRGTRPYFAS